MKTRLAVVFSLACVLVASLRAAENLPPCYGVVELPAQAHPWVGQAWADFDLLLVKLGMTGGLDPASVRVKTEGGDLLPCRFEPEKKDGGRGVITWQAPAESKDVEKTRFRIYFAPRSGTSWKPTDASRVGKPNLLPNGGFDQEKEVNGWLLRAGMPEFVQVVEDPKAAHSGQKCVKMLPHALPKQEISHACDIASSFVRVEPGQQYSVNAWHRSEDVTKSSVKVISNVSVYWYSDEQTYLKHENAAVDVSGTETWTDFSHTFQAPPNATRAALFFYFFGMDGAFYLDDLEFNPSECARLNSAQMADGSKKVQAFMQGEGIWRFDFGLTPSRSWPGFTAVTPASKWSTEKKFGWIDPDGLSAVDRGQPDDLARDYIISTGRSKFAVDLADGEYVAWVLHGDSGFGVSVLPRFLRWEFGCDDRVLKSHAVPDAKAWYDTVMFRHFKDWWRPGVDVYDRFIASQFEEDQFPFTARRGRAIFFPRAFRSAG